MSDNKDPQQLLDMIQAAAFLGIRRSRIRAAVFRREIPFIKIGRLVRFDPRALETWLSAHTVGARAG